MGIDKQSYIENKEIDKLTGSNIKVPEGKMTSPEYKKGRKPLGTMRVPEIGDYEFFIPSSLGDGLDLIAADNDGEEITIIKVLLGDNDSIVFRPVINRQNFFMETNKEKYDEIIGSYLLEANSSRKSYIEYIRRKKR